MDFPVTTATPRQHVAAFCTWTTSHTASAGVVGFVHQSGSARGQLKRDGSGMSKSNRIIFIALYCIALWLAFDLVYSNAIVATNTKAEPTSRAKSVIFHHGLQPNFDGIEGWGPFRYRFATNNLGLRDETVRDVPMHFDGRRIILIGDSFTEGSGLPFEKTFAGMLALSPSARQNKTEVLNAGVVSYSPVIYYKKIKHLLDIGVRFDEVVAFPDISDVQDEATSYFCIDEDVKYRQYCREDSSHEISRSKLLSNFVVTHRVQSLAKNAIVQWRGGHAAKVMHRLPRSGWTIPGFDVGNHYAPLGIEGGITRGLQNMQLLGDLLKSRGISLRLVVYPWPMQLAKDDRNSRHVAMWRDFCARNCRDFINLFPTFFNEKDMHSDWYERLFIVGDVHFSAEGNKLVFRAVAKRLIPGHGAGVGDRSQADGN